MAKEHRTVSADDVFATFSLERQKKINARAVELIAEEFALRDLREAKQMTQEAVAQKLGGRQVYVSRLERRKDMKLSTLRDYVGAIGGTLELVVSFPTGRSIKLADLGGAALVDRSARKGPLAARKKVNHKASKRT